MEILEVEYIQLGKKELSHIRKEVCSTMRCVITSYLIAITLIKIGYFIHECKKKGCKPVKQKVNEDVGLQD